MTVRMKCKICMRVLTSLNFLFDLVILTVNFKYAKIKRNLRKMKDNKVFRLE